ncbi:MAG: PEP-CTERM sorting domain-containing protein [Planctomycetota bacterium]|nr:PEP-CTERM sorting domain-containing protein [Planctomycetota bacterium]
MSGGKMSSRLALVARVTGLRVVALGVLSLAALGGMSKANAGTVNFSVDATVLTADPGNAFGLSGGETITLSGSYDDSAYNGVGAGIVYFDNGSGNHLSLVLGGVTLNETNDDAYMGGGFPYVSFIDGNFAGAGFLGSIVNGQNYDFNLNMGTFDATDAGMNGIHAEFNFVSGPSPEPSTIVLAGVGALGLIVVRHRRSRRHSVRA